MKHNGYNGQQRGLALVGLLMVTGMAMAASAEIIHGTFNKGNDLIQYNINADLRDEVVNYIFQDSERMFWCATDNGLVKYNGEFTNYELAGSSSLSYKNAFTRRQCYIDEIGKMILLMAEDSLTFFDKTYERFFKVINESKAFPLISDATVAQNNQLAVTSGTSVSLFQVKFNHTGNLATLSPVVVSGPIFMKMEHPCQIKYSPSFQWLIVATDRGRIFFLDPNTLEVLRIVSPPDVPEGKLQPNYLYEDRNGFFVLYNNWNFAVHYNYYSHNVVNIPLSDDTNPKLSEKGGYAVCQGMGESYLLSSYDGILTVKFTDESQYSDRYDWNFTTYDQQEFEELREKKVISLLRVKDYILMGTTGGGVYRRILEEYNSYYTFQKLKNIRSVCVDSLNYVWIIGQDNQLFHSTNPLGQGPITSFQKFDFPAPYDKLSYTCSYVDKEGNGWMGTADGGVLCRNQKSEELLLYTFRYTVPDPSIKYIYRDSKGYVWLALSKGVFRFMPTATPSSAQLVRMDGGNSREMHNIYAMQEVADGSVYIGGYEGLFRYRPTQGFEDILEINTLPSFEKKLSTYALTTNKEGSLLYVGTIKGTGVLDVANSKWVTYFDHFNSLFNDCVLSLLVDDDDILWMGTRQSFSVYHPRENTMVNYPEMIKNTTFLAKGAGRIVMANNYQLFDRAMKEATIPEMSDSVGFASLYINNRKVIAGEKVNGQVVLEKRLYETRRLVLNEKNKNIVIHFFHMTNMDNNYFYYRLYPYQKDWIETSQESGAVLMNIPAGKYQLEVKVSNSTVKESPISRLEIVRTQSTFEALWFQLLIYLIPAAILALFILHWRQNLIQKNKLEKMESLNRVNNMENEHLQQIAKERDSFFSYVAHELRTPLTLISAPVDELLKKSNKNSFENFEDYENLSRIKRNAEVLNDLVEKLLYIRKIQTNVVQISVKQYNLNLLLKNMRDGFMSVAALKKMHFEVVEAPEPVMAWVDVGKMDVAVRNVVSNAFKYTPDGGSIKVSLVLETRDGQPYACFKVTDTGFGIPKEERSSIFNQFSTGQNNPTYSSKMGLGLYIVKHTLDQHHGFVSVDSEVGKGSTFSLYIPMGNRHFVGSDGVRVNIDVDVKQTFYTITPEMLSAKRLCVVDDNDEIRTMLYALFSPTYEVVQAPNGLEALTVIRKTQPGLVVLDVMMPKMDGFECARQLKKEADTCAIPIIFLSAKHEETDIEEGMELGSVDYMSKPFSPTALKAKVNEMLLQRMRLEYLFAQTLMLESKYKFLSDCPEFVRQSMFIIYSHLEDSGFNPDNLAAKMQLPVGELNRKIHTVTRISLADYILRVRLNKAAEMLLVHHRNVSFVSRKLGYVQETLFGKDFSAQFGILPMKFVETIYNL